MPDEKLTPVQEVRQDKEALQIYFPETPDWEFWRQRNGCRLWSAVLLSMNIEPSVPAREELREKDPAKYSQYQKRLNLVKGAYGTSDLLPCTQHKLAGPKQTESWVVLTNMLAFSKASLWPDRTLFEAGMTLDSSVDEAASAEAKDQVVPGIDFDDLKKGERYTVLRFGALLKLIESWMLSDSNNNKADYLHGGKLNQSAIGIEIQNILAKKCMENESKAPRNFGAQVNSKRISEALNAFDSL